MSEVTELKPLMHPFLDTYNDNEVKQAAVDYLELLLHKIGMLPAARALRLYVPTLHRVMNPDLPVESVSYLTAAYIIFMCETNVKILRIMDNHPQGTAYYKRNKI